MLAGLASELMDLRRPLAGAPFQDPTAQRMAAAIAPYEGIFVTPMAAVAEAVADKIVFALVKSCGGRIHSRMGDLELWVVKSENGLG